MRAAHRRRLIAALKVVVDAYDKSIDPGHSDLYNEQPHHFTVNGTLGDFRTLQQMLWVLEDEARKS